MGGARKTDSVIRGGLCRAGRGHGIDTLVPHRTTMCDHQAGHGEPNLLRVDHSCAFEPLKRRLDQIGAHPQPTRDIENAGFNPVSTQKIEGRYDLFISMFHRCSFYTY